MEHDREAVGNSLCEDFIMSYPSQNASLWIQNSNNICVKSYVTY